MKTTCTFLGIIFSFLSYSQTNWDALIKNNLKDIIWQHKEFVSIPNLPEDKDLMLKHMNWVIDH